MPYYPAIHVPSSHNSNNIWREVQIMELFIMQFHSLSFYFQVQSLNTLNSIIPIFSLESSLKVTNQVSYTRIYKKYWVNMHTFITQKSCFRQQSKIIWICTVHYSKFAPHFLILQSLFTSPLKYLRSSTPFQNAEHWIRCFQVMIFFSANQMIKRCHTVSVLYRPNFQLPSNTALNFYSPYVVTRYYSITTTEMKLLFPCLIQFIYVPVSIQG
jgi:hypothetical protein